MEKITASAMRIESARAERDRLMARARLEGRTWQAIADAAGMTPNGVRKALGYKRTGQLG